MAQVGSARELRGAGRPGERRVHDDDARPEVRQQVSDVLGVVTAHAGAGEGQVQEARPCARQLVERQASAVGGVEAERGRGGERAGAGRGLEHDVAGGHAGAGRDAPGELERRRELLEALLHVVAARLGRLQQGDARDEGQHLGRVCGPGDHGGPEPAQQQCGRHLARLVRLLPQPGPVGVRAAERVGHGVPKRPGIDGAALLQVAQERRAGGEDALRGIGRRGVRWS